jgi:hypothetical protein
VEKREPKVTAVFRKEQFLNSSADDPFIMLIGKGASKQTDYVIGQLAQVVAWFFPL